MKKLRLTIHLLALVPVFALAQNTATPPAVGTIRGIITRAGNGEPAFAHVNSAFMANYENRGKPVHVGESGTATTELTLIPVVSK